MQKIFFFEINTAIKDRPTYFRIITLALFAISLTIIVVGSLLRFSTPERSTVATKQSHTGHPTEFASITAERSFVRLEK